MWKREPRSFLLNLGDGRFVLGLDVNRSGSWRDRALPLSRRAWDLWDAEQRRRLGFWAGLAGPTRTNTPRSWNLVARHWPHRLCWSWLIWANVARGGERWARFGITFSRRYRSGQIMVGPFGIGLSWQDADYMIASPFLDDPDVPRVRFQPLEGYSIGESAH